MLRSFRLGNHRSFRDEQELLLMPAYSKDREVLPVAAVYGANASGKSNLLTGLRFMAEAVRDSFAVWDPTLGVPRREFVLDDTERPSVFVVELVLEGVRYTYGFEVDTFQVLEEWLYSYPEGRKRVVFERDAQGVRFGSTVGDRPKLELLSDLLRRNALFLSLAAQSDISHVLPIRAWFLEALRFRFNCGEVDEGEIIDFLDAGSSDRDQVVDLLRAADLGITRLFTTDGAGAKPRRVRVEHGVGKTLFLLRDESAGTQSWLGLLPTVLTVLRGGGVLVIDEIDASLHPLLAARLIGLFHDVEVNTAGAQLIFTTHDATLLHPPLGEEVLARDEIWFVEKDRESGASSLYPLSDFKPRTEDNLERRYLAGRYGAVPELSQDSFTQAVRSGRGEA
ncbi:ATP/GTP-binding protein [Lentzea sp. CC55]|uniref:AAA family ATPase n=1 Tax=Lentzea sp. CC55 TaxID=2884909 RepID=UPI001F40C635|nr:ATP-binding protein [Lentzea sp. CC55]MCG8922925.1 ATP-binding protein [Lentzea sp. CC55]